MDRRLDRLRRRGLDRLGFSPVSAKERAAGDPLSGHAGEQQAASAITERYRRCMLRSRSVAEAAMPQECLILWRVLEDAVSRQPFQDFNLLVGPLADNDRHFFVRAVALHHQTQYF